MCVGSVRCVELQTMSYLVLEKFLNAKVLTRPSFGPRNTAVESTPNKGKTIHFLSSCANNCCHEKKRKEGPKKKSLRAVSPRGEVIGWANNLYATRKCLPKDSLNSYIEKRDLRTYTTT